MKITIEFLETSNFFRKTDMNYYIFKNITPVKIYHDDILYKNFSYNSLYENNAVFDKKYQYCNNDIFGEDDILSYYLELYELVINDKVSEIKSFISIYRNENLYQTIMYKIIEDKGYENWLKFKEKIENLCTK